MFVFMVHPRFEELNVKPFCGTRCQCTRKWFLREHDLKNRERLAREGKPTYMIDRLCAPPHPTTAHHTRGKHTHAHTPPPSTHPSRHCVPTVMGVRQSSLLLPEPLNTIARLRL